MSEPVPLGEEELLYPDAPRQKSRGPLFWVLGGCGCGCLVIVLALVVGGIFAYRKIDEGTRDEVKWPALQEALAFEERPADIQLDVYLEIFGYEQFHMSHEGLGLSGFLSVYESPEEADALFDPDVVGSTGDEDEAVQRIEVQGREVRYVVFDNAPDLSQVPEFMRDWVEPDDPRALGTTLRADLSDGSRGRILDLGRTGTEPVTPAELETFLESFDVWAER